MKTNIFISLFIVFLTFTGCGYKEGIKTSGQKSYLYFTGNVEDASVVIDNGPGFSVKSGINNQYQIKPGKHLVQVFRNNVMIVNREIYVGDEIAKEIEVQP